MILAGGDPEAVISASMLPQDVGSMVPTMPNGGGGEQLMGLALREAREVFEREYLLAQISRFGGNISRTAEFVGMERSALHRKLKALGVGSCLCEIGGAPRAPRQFMHLLENISLFPDFYGEWPHGSVW